MPTAIIYAAGSKSIRRIVVDDDEARLVGHLGSGEGVVLVGEKIAAPSIIKTRDGDDAELFYAGAGQRLPDLDRCNALVEELTGVKPADARCVVLAGKGDDLEVTAAIMADPVLDAHPDGFVVREPEAIPGDVLKGDGEFYRDLDGEAVKVSEYDAAVKAKEDAKSDAPAEMVVL